MLNYKYNKRKNKFTITYNTREGVKQYTNTYKDLKIIENDNGIYTNLDNSKRYDIATQENNEGAVYMFNCLYNSQYNKPDYYLNTILQPDQLPRDLFEVLEPPKLIFYDVETNEYATQDIKDDQNRARINSIAWIDAETNEEHILIRERDGSERDILNKFVTYCKKHNIMGLVGHNSAGFDDKITRIRCSNCGVNPGNLFYNNCNLDTMVLAQFFQYSAGRISLNELSNVLNIDEGKETITDNPVTLYNKALHDADTMELFIKYNLQDVRVTKLCFERMESIQQLNALFMDTLTPFNKMKSNSILLNCYTCKNALKEYKVIPENVNTEINFKNAGGFNYCEIEDKKRELRVYNNILVLDVVSYYPHLLMLIGADPTHPYENINRDTGKINKFDGVPNGYLSKLSKELYESRAEIKQQMKETNDDEKRATLDHQQKTKKIIVNSLYGVLSQRGNFYVLKNELIGATITAIGRDILNHVIQEFNGVYGKTDSVFIPFEPGTNTNELLNQVNKYVNKYVSERYNLGNIREGYQLIRFEIDGILKRLIVKDKNNYIKVFEDGTYKLKGGSFNTVKLSEFEQDLNKEIINYLITNESIDNMHLTDIITEFTKNKLNTNTDITYYSKIERLSDNPNKLKQVTQTAREYMDDHNINYFNGFNYLICKVNNYKQDYIMFPKGYEPDDVTLYKPYAYELTGNRLYNFNIIDNATRSKYNKTHKVRKTKQVKNDKGQKTLNELPVFSKNNFKSWNKNNVKNKNLLRLNETITDTMEFYNQGKIKFIGIFPGGKKPDIVKGTEYTHEYINDHPQKFDVTKFKQNYNIGLIRGLNGLRVLDIDGLKFLGAKLNAVLKRYLYEKIINNINYPFICQLTQSKGYHLLYFDDNTENTNNSLSNIYFPKKRPDDFPKEITNVIYNEKLAGVSFGASTIELFNDFNGFIVFAPSTTKDGEYKILNNDGVTWKQLFNTPVYDLRDQLDNTFKNAGFMVTDRTAKPGHNKNVEVKRNNLLKEFEGDTLTELCKLTVKLFELVHPYNAKHYTAVYLGGFYSQYISLSNAEIIADAVIKDVGELMDDTERFLRDFLDNYEREINKKTLSGINEHTGNDNEVTEILIKISDIVKGTENVHIKEYDAIITSDEIRPESVTQEPTKTTSKKPVITADPNKVFNYSNKSNNSFLTANSSIKYAISREHLDKLNNAKEQLLKLFDDEDKPHITRLLNGAFKHFLIPPKYKIPGYEETKIYNNNNVYEIGKTKRLYGFPTIENVINGLQSLDVNNKKKGKTVINKNGYPETKTIEFKTFADTDADEDTDEKQEKQRSKALKQIKQIKRVIDEITILNPTYYICDGYRQQNNELFKSNNEKVGYFAFTEIKKVNMFNPIRTQFSNNQPYNFKLVDYNGKTITYENITIESLVSDLFNRKLIIGNNKTAHLTDIIKFINETNKKQGLQTETLPVCPGFFINKNIIISYFPGLSTEYELHEGVEILNDIFTNVFKNNIKYGSIYWAGLLMSLCNVFKGLNLEQIVNRNLLLLGLKGTLKTTVCNMVKQSFDKLDTFEESNEGDTVPAIARNMSLTTLPMVNDDPGININSKEFKDLLKNVAFSYSANQQAKEQYGDETNRRDAFRLLMFSHNDTNFNISDKGGEQRRVNIVIFTDADRPTDEQLNALDRVINTIGGEMLINKLNAIGNEYRKFIIGYFMNFTQSKRDNIKKTFGWCIIDDFIKHLERVTNIQLCDGLRLTKNYEFDDLTEDETLKLYERLRFNFEETLKKHNVTVEYDTATVSNYAGLCSWLYRTQDNRQSDGAVKYYLRRKEFLQFVKSNACLGRYVDADELLKMLKLDETHPEGFKEKRGASKGVNDSKKPYALELTAEEILIHLLNEPVNL